MGWATMVFNIGMVAVLSATPAILAVAVTSGRTPPNPVTVSMYNLRPYNLTSDIREKDSADAMGDIFFYITDRLITPYACRYSIRKHLPLPFMCRDFQKVLQTNNQVYTQLQVQVDGSFGGCASGSISCSQYADCNPEILGNGSLQWMCNCDSQGLTTDAHKLSAFDTCRSAVDSSGCNKRGSSFDACVRCARMDKRVLASNCSSDELNWFCSGPPIYCKATGKLAVSSRYCGSIEKSTGLCSLCADGCEGIWSSWKSQVAALGGLWYSTAKEGDCSDSLSQHCAWKVVKNVKTVNATCANGNLHVAVEKKGHNCFSRCSQPKNSTSDCWILCFMETVLGRDPLNLSSIRGTAMTASELLVPWLKAFESDDPLEGGCAALPPDLDAEPFVV